MKKIKLIPLCLASVLALGACTMPSWFPFGKKDNEQQDGSGSDDSAKKYDINPEITGGTEAEKKAILEAINKKPICQQFAKSTVTMYPDSNLSMEEHKYHNIKLTTKQKMGDLFVDLTWAVDTNQEYFGKLHHLPDGVHDLIEIKYKGYNQPDGEIKWSLAKVVCGSAESSPNLEYSAKVKNETYVHDNVSIAELVAVTDEPKTVVVDGITHNFPSTFDKVDYSENSRNDGAYSPFWVPNNPTAKDYPDYYYVSVPGKIIYTSPDGNWGLLADGKNVVEIYSGSGTGFVEENWPNLAGKYVRVEGNMSMYNGNSQMGYVTKIAALTEAEKAAIVDPEPLVYRDMNETELAALKVEGFSNQKMAVSYPDGGTLMNGLAEVRGTLVAGSINQGDNEGMEPSALKYSERCTFDLKVGAQQITVAYDYHTDRDGKSGVMAALIAALQKTGEISIKGTMRYNGDKGFICEDNSGTWQITPFLASHIA